jgi:hypothetical protein
MSTLDVPRGLSTAEATRQRSQAVCGHSQRGTHEPMSQMLLAADSIYPALGSQAEALFLLGFVFVVIGITLA